MFIGWLFQVVQLVVAWLWVSEQKMVMVGTRGRDTLHFLVDVNL